MKDSLLVETIKNIRRVRQSIAEQLAAEDLVTWNERRDALLKAADALHHAEIWVDKAMESQLFDVLEKIAQQRPFTIRDATVTAPPADRSVLAYVYDEWRFATYSKGASAPKGMVLPNADAFAVWLVDSMEGKQYIRYWVDVHSVKPGEL